MTLRWTSPNGQYQNQTDYILCSQRWRSSTQSAKTRTGANNGLDHELLIAKFRVNLKKVVKTTRPFRCDFPGGSNGKASAYNAGDLGSIPGSKRSSGEGNGISKVKRQPSEGEKIIANEVKVAQSCLTLKPHRLYSPWDSPGQNTGVDSLFLLQGIFLTQESNWGLLYCRRVLYQLSYQVSAIDIKTSSSS